MTDSVSTWGQASDWHWKNVARRQAQAKTFQINCKHVTNYCGKSLPLTRLKKAAWWIEFRNELQDEHPTWAPATANRVVCLAKTVVNSTRRAGLHDIEVPDFPNLKEAEIKPEYFTRDQVEELSLTARKMFEWQDMSDAIVFAAYTGMRQANLMRAQVGDIDWDMNRIGVGGRPDNPTKAGNCYWVPMSPRLEEILRRRSEGHSARALLFGNCWDDRHQLLKHFKKLRDYCQFSPSHNWHTFRHTFATWLAESESPATIAKLTGHRDVTSVLRYTKPNEKVCRDAIRNL